MRLVRSDNSLRPNKNEDKINSHRNTQFQFSSRDIANSSKGEERMEDVSFVVDRAGVKSAQTDDACTKHRHRELPIRYTSSLPLLKVTDHATETKNESQTSQSHVQLGRRPANFPRKYVPRIQLSNYYSTSKTTSAKRYHVDDDPRFSALKPGVISESLREALGISQNQLPLYIYNMRRLGYPPGHLENARRQQSGILIFSKDGCEVTPEGKILEEGEVNDEQEEVLFDVTKLIDFPGFNIHPPDGTLEECEILDFPFMQADQSKEEMMRMLTSATGKERSINDAAQSYEAVYVRERENSPTINFGEQADNRAATKTSSYSEEKTSIWLSEMGLSAADGWLVLDSLPEMDDDLSEISTTSPNSAVERNSFPLEQLQNRSVDNTVMPRVSLDECLASDQALMSPSQESIVGMELSGNSDFGESIARLSRDVEWKNSSAYGGSLDVTPGTPVVADAMFWSKRVPDASLFSLGMSEPLPYENLPNATGAFRKLRTVLIAARCRSKRLSY